MRVLKGRCGGIAMSVTVSLEIGERFDLDQKKLHLPTELQMLCLIREKLPEGALINEAFVVQRLGELEREWGLEHVKIR